MTRGARQDAAVHHKEPTSAGAGPPVGAGRLAGAGLRVTQQKSAKQQKCRPSAAASLFHCGSPEERSAWTRAHAHVSVGLTLLPPPALPLPIPVMCSVGEMCHPSASVHRGSSPRGHMHERVHAHPQMLSELGVVSCQHRRRPTPTL